MTFHLLCPLCCAVGPERVRNVSVRVSVCLCVCVGGGCCQFKKAVLDSIMEILEKIPACLNEVTPPPPPAPRPRA